MDRCHRRVDGWQEVGTRGGTGWEEGQGRGGVQMCGSGGRCADLDVGILLVLVGVECKPPLLHEQ